MIDMSIKRRIGAILKRNDIIIAALLVIVAIICAIVMQVFVKKDGNVAVVSIDGQVYKELSLNVNTELEINEANGVDGYNILVIDNGYAYMKDADCVNKICVHQGKINKVGETIVCLPHKVVIEIKGETTELDGVAQ